MTNKFDRIQENANKPYVVRNCPAYDCSITEWNCLGSDATECKNGNCILKQIVGLCEQYKKDYNTTNGVWLLTNNIINLLDIQECE